MKADRRLRAFGGIGALLAIASAPGLAQPAMNPEEGWTAIARCAGIADDARRHACADQVFRDAGLLASPEARAQARDEVRRREFGLQTPESRRLPEPEPVAPQAPTPAPVARAPVPAPPPAPRQAPPPPAPARPINADQVEVKLAGVMLGGDRKLVLTTTDGAEWYQADSGDIRPTPSRGQTMTIERGALGSFQCKTGRWTTFRCLRRR